MPSGLKGYNIYLDGVKKNIRPIQPGNSFQLNELTQGTVYAGRITVTAVDNAGNESTPKSLTTLGVTATTTTPPTSTLVLGAATTSAIDAAVAERIKPNTQADGAIIGISTAQGDYYKAYGTDRVSPLTLNHRMRWGSTSKMWVGLLILKHIDDGHLSFDDTVSEFVTGVPNGNAITIKQLLMMQDGLKDPMQQDQTVMTASFLSPTSPFDAMAYIRNSVPNFPPGQPPAEAFNESNLTKYPNSTYSNSAYVVLSRILEKLDETYGSSRTYRQIIVDDVGAPDKLNLATVEWPTGNYMTPPYARGWAFNPIAAAAQQTLGILFPLLGWLTPIVIPGSSLAPEVEWTALTTTYLDAAGSLDGDIYDLVKFGKALVNGDLLSEDMANLRDETWLTYKKFNRSAIPEYWPDWIAFGLGVMQAGHWIGWPGNIAGYNVCLFANRETGAVVSVMLPFGMNQTKASSIALGFKIMHLLDPASMQSALPQKIRVQEAISSSSSVASPTLYAYHAPGDEDSNVQVPLKVPFFV